MPVLNLRPRALRALCLLTTMGLAATGSMLTGAHPASAWLDGTFHSPLPATDAVYAVNASPDGTVWVGGSFVGSGKNLHHLNRDGSLDVEFESGEGVGFNGAVRSIAVLDGGVIVVGGDFTTYKGGTVGHLVELDEAGNLLSTFGASADGSVFKLLRLPDDSVIVTGNFTHLDGVAAVRMAKVKSGARDATFDVGAGFDSIVWDAARQPDGRIVLVGTFLNAGGHPHAGIARVSSTGVVDPTFNPSTDQTALSVGVLSTGRILVGGVFTKVDAVNHRSFAFLNPNGTLVPSGAGGIVGTIDPDSFVYDITILPGDVALVSGAFTNFSGLPGEVDRGVVKVLPNGYMRGPFNVGNGVNSGGVVVETTQLSDGRLVMGGSFTAFANEAQNAVAVVTDGPMPPQITGVTPRNASAVVTFRAPSGDGGDPVLGMYVNYANADYSSNGACTITSIIYDTAKALCTGLKNGTVYSIYVTAWNKETSGEPASIKVRPRTVPTAPRSLKVSFPSAKHAKVSWSVPASTGGVVIARYELCRSACTVAGSWHSTGVTAGKPNLSSVLALAKGTKVTVKIRAVNVAGAGAAATLTFTQAK